MQNDNFTPLSEELLNQTTSKVKKPNFFFIGALIVAFIFLSGTIYTIYFLESKKALAEKPQSIPITSVTNKPIPTTNRITPALENSANPITSSVHLGYAVQNQFGGYFVMISINATSTQGTITEVAVWADEDTVPKWEPYEGDVGMTVELTTEKKSNIYVQFKDRAGNLSEKETILQQEIENAREDKNNS